MGHQIANKPGLVIESYTIDNQGIPIPVANRVSHPCRIRIVGMGATVQIHLAIVGLLNEQLHQNARVLNDSVKKRKGRIWLDRQAEGPWPVSEIVFTPLLSYFCSPCKGAAGSGLGSTFASQTPEKSGLPSGVRGAGPVSPA